ncbi:MAG: class I SAM-dependent methyltransferase [Candidatus Sericytochromatia bacterium]|nr:class I SAM-dependent methyltransferase [Candidatus Sericytochromatia bacterium]
MTATPDLGRETLHLVETHLGRYNGWMFEQLAPAITGRVLEIGSGTGTMSAFLEGAPRLALTDVEPASLRDLEARFGGQPGVTVDPWDLNEDVPARLRDEAFDTVVCLNVLEHIADDEAALRRMHGQLAPGGRLVLLVPAHPLLFNGFDRGVRHFRRYERRGLTALLTRTGFEPERAWYFNMLGALGWFVNGNLLGKTLLPAGQLRLIDALVPVLRAEQWLPRPFGLSVIAIARRPVS